MRRGFILLLLITLCLPSFSQSQSSEEAALAFYEINYPYSTSLLQSTGIDTSFTYRNLTIVNFTSPGGFVIIKSTASGEEIAGYSYTDQFLFEADTTGAIEKWADALSMSSDQPGYSPDTDVASLKTGMLAVEPLVQTAWNQGWAYRSDGVDMARDEVVKGSALWTTPTTFM